MQPILEKFKNHVSFDKFLQDCYKYKKDKQTYDISYPHFLEYFKNLDKISKHNLVIGINFTYGWMPTIFDFRSEKFDEAVSILNDAKKGILPTVEELEILKGLFNKSLVGTSKLLHFINPDKFAIWDSRVYRYLTGEEAYDQRIGNCEAYLSFLTFLEFLTQKTEYEKAHNFICDKLGYPMTKFRTAELIMYLNGEKQKRTTS
jgi:hypothetical protein